MSANEGGGVTHFPQQIFNFLFKPLKIQSNYLFYCNNVTYRNHIIYLSKTVGEKKKLMCAKTGFSVTGGPAQRGAHYFSD